MGKQNSIWKTNKTPDQSRCGFKCWIHVYLYISFRILMLREIYAFIINNNLRTCFFVINQNYRQNCYMNHKYAYRRQTPHAHTLHTLNITVYILSTLSIHQPAYKSKYSFSKILYELLKAHRYFIYKLFNKGAIM